MPRCPIPCLLLLAAAAVLGAAEPAGDAGAGGAAAPAAAEPAEPFRWTAEDIQRYTIENEHAVLTISNFRASIRSFALKGIHPIALPEWRGGLGEDTPTDAPLEVLSSFYSETATREFGTDMHNFVVGLELPPAAPGGPQEGPWRLVERGPARLVLEQTDEARGLTWRMSYRLADDRPTAQVRLTLHNGGDERIDVAPTVYALSGIHQDDALSDRWDRRLVVSREGDLDTWGFPDKGEIEKFDAVPAPALDYAGLTSRFFGALWDPVACRVVSGTGQPADRPAGDGVIDRAFGDVDEAAPVPGTFRVRLSAAGFRESRGDEHLGQAWLMAQLLPADAGAFVVEPGQTLECAWNITITSMREEHLELLTAQEAEIEYADVWYRFLRLLVNVLTFFLDLFYLVVRHYAVALILLVILVKAALHRANVKQQSSMLKMQKLAPELKRIQERYKNDRQTLATKQMELFRKEQINPAAGCLPILIQMPIFFALYQTFRHDADMRGTGFLWVRDLTLPDQLLYLGFTWPFTETPATLNPLPLIYLAVSVWMSWQHKLPANATDQQRQMAYMMRALPVVFSVVFYNMPAGLVLYFCCSAIIGALEMKWIRKRLGGTGMATPM